MHLRVVIIFLATLSLSKQSFAQKDRMFDSIEEAMLVNPDSVYRLDLSRKKLTDIPKEIQNFKNLRELDLSKNKLENLPDFLVFKDLRILNLTKNKFKRYPEVVNKNLSLRNLFLGKNSIDLIPESIGNLEQLIVLDLWYNPITDLPNSMEQLRNLRSLDLSGLNFDDDFQRKWNSKLHWVKIEFESACDCAN